MEAVAPGRHVPLPAEREEHHPPPEEERVAVRRGRIGGPAARAEMEDPPGRAAAIDDVDEGDGAARRATSRARSTICALRALRGSKAKRMRPVIRS